MLNRARNKVAGALNRARNKALNAIIGAAHRGPIGLEVWLSITALRWAIFLIMPPTVLHNNTSATMHTMATFAPLWLWSLGFVFGAVFQSWAAIRHHYRLRILAAMTGMLWWLMIAAFDAFTALSTASINIATFALAELFVFILLILAYDPEDLP
jgi:hypothetical protein